MAKLDIYLVAVSDRERHLLEAVRKLPVSKRQPVESAILAGNSIMEAVHGGEPS